MSSRADPTADPQELAAGLRLSIARLARLLRQQAGTGLSPSQTSVLVSVALQGPLTLGRLARIEQVTPPSITKIVTRLESDGLVVREVDTTDRRIVRVSVTDEGHRRLEHSRQRRNAWLAQQLVAMSAAERRRLEAALPVLEALASADVADAATGAAR
ncbi:MAG: MarR family winged helix-turn-helix transcriptional regulator [Acidimicrobiales bacterium]